MGTFISLRSLPTHSHCACTDEGEVFESFSVSSNYSNMSSDPVFDVVCTSGLCVCLTFLLSLAVIVSSAFFICPFFAVSFCRSALHRLCTHNNTHYWHTATLVLQAYQHKPVHR